jgi:hypothetical protein
MIPQERAMASKSTVIDLTAFSVRVYQLLLNAYPTQFQQEYGSQMIQVFEDCCLRAVRQGRTNGMFRLWLVTFLDLIQSVISEHARKEIEMKKEMKPDDIRMAGWALIWGAAAFVISLFLLIIGEARNDMFWGQLSGLLMMSLIPALLVGGLLGVRNRYGDKVGQFGKNILLLGVILGPLTTLIGFFGMLGLFENRNIGWHLTYVGPGVLFAGLALFGIVALYKRPLPRWNVAPVLAGLWYPIAVLSHIFIGMRHGNWLSGGPSYAMAPILFIIQAIALAALGYILKSDVLEETAALV